ncbi:MULTISPECIES: peptidylprolyl isomerase [Cellulophaga]|uniref:Periplasmic chaperone PpiD n=2 Tax=Cellulophaga TaxID=104264 RepID=F0RCF1_CELLC|nr:MULTISPECIES: peptidylprolyl isomerase [Cellulophaga]ADY28628.1 PpiC-type peptidyl-prolyl cis-trans isomerase [Cellulophaga lytica DSM 7489]APU09540.1 peptidylprolyl isomerase [Cellulophaga lytica]EWH12883.1 PpiC-type peptidyl-prolyl cis-trans isomerase [Cellulophaga geojensis KL-A]TVZ08805.1 peptidyl-prolyl cis-trans isomerase D [Cellulophaga sp. RHA_52]WQG77195.1 peptidylprolyl isomerase [Cellulophaga lytica]
MAILENIRKRTTVLILIIGLALFAFVISGIFSADGMSGVKTGTTVAEINGKDISIDKFRREVEAASNRFGAGATSMQVVNSVWDQEVKNAILSDEFDDLGISIEQDQIINFIASNPGFSQNPQYQNENGVFDEYIFKEFISTLKTENPAQYALWLQQEQAIMQAAKEQTYFNLVKAGLGATLKEGELDYKLANDKIDIKYVRVPYTSIADSSVAVSKDEIAAYIKDHEEDFKQEKARDFQFVYFEEKPSLEDEKAVEAKVVSLLNDKVEYNDTILGFRNTKNIEEFLDRNSDLKYDTIYKTKNVLSPKFADTLMALNIGDIYGPYRDGNYFKVTKMMDKKKDGNVKASHILVAWEGAERANPEVKRTKEEAKKRAEELLKDAKKGDVEFSVLARDNSDGPSASRGGDLGYSQQGRMTPKFDEFMFSNNVGTIGMVETEFGFHIVKIDDKQDLVRVATLARAIEASEATINSLFTEATQFESDAKDSDKTFLELSKEKKYVARPVNKIKAMDENLPGLAAQRAIVQWAFNDDSEVGDIKRFPVNNGYAVVQLTGKYKEGLMSVEDASFMVLPKLRKEKKAAQIIAANKGKSIDAIAKDNNVSASTASALTMKSPTIPGAGREPFVVGSAFGLNQGDTSGLLEGETGVFMLTVTKKEEAPKLDNYSTYANMVQTTAMQRANSAVLNALKKSAEIEDNRAMFY